jgi:hypothetical protein
MPFVPVDHKRLREKEKIDKLIQGHEQNRQKKSLSPGKTQTSLKKTHEEYFHSCKTIFSTQVILQQPSIQSRIIVEL